MVFRFRCIEFIATTTEFNNRHNRHTKSSTSQSERKTKSSSADSYHSAESDFPVLSSDGPNHLRVFTYMELEEATCNFSQSFEIGEGESGSLYKAVIQHHNTDFEFVVKRLTRRHITGQKEWAMAVNFIGMVEHPNLVKLVGYCADDERGIERRLIVYEYMPNRSVEYNLSTRSEAPLSWTMRLKLAQEVARGLTYLHEKKMYFRGFKSSDILFDNHWNAKLSYFDLAWSGYEGKLTNVSTKMVGSSYVRQKRLRMRSHTSNCDVWSYGVFLYELITGRPPLDKNRPKNEQKLVEWVKPFIGSKMFQLIVDPRLEHNYSLELAQKLSVIANKCLLKNPKSRPKMSDVLEKVNKLIAVPSKSTSPEPVIVAKLKKIYLRIGKSKRRHKE